MIDIYEIYALLISHEFYVIYFFCYLKKKLRHVIIFTLTLIICSKMREKTTFSSGIYKKFVIFFHVYCSLNLYPFTLISQR